MFQSPSGTYPPNNKLFIEYPPPPRVAPPLPPPLPSVAGSVVVERVVGMAMEVRMVGVAVVVGPYKERVSFSYAHAYFMHSSSHTTVLMIIYDCAYCTRMIQEVGLSPG